MDPEPYPFLTSLLSPQGLTSIQVVLILLLLALSALVSGSEIAFFSLNPKRLESDKKNNTTISIILSLLYRPKRLLATILVANNFINIAIVLLFASLSNTLFKQIENPAMRILLEVVSITAFILLFGEILPKIYANRNALSFSKIMARPILFMDRYLLFWITIPISRLTRFAESKLIQKNSQFSLNELSQALKLTNDDNTTVQEQKILEGIVAFGNTETRQVMCPRIDIFAISEAMSLQDILPQIMEKGFSRIPVYKEKKDAISGILYIKDMLPHIEKKEVDWQALIRPCFYVPENKKLDDLLHEFKEKKIHMAIVVDEYGGTSGLITLDDILEEIVGDISDEFDQELLNYTQLDAHTFIFDAKISLKDFYKVIGLKDPDIFERVKGDSETLAGLLLELAQKFPKKNQKIVQNQFTFVVSELERMRIKTVKVMLPNSPRIE